MSHKDESAIYGKTNKLYTNDEHGASVRINPLNTPDKMMILGAFAGEAYNMEMMGVIEHRDDIAKMIEQDRLDAAAREQNMPVGAQRSTFSV